ncbi:MAG: type II toxin-antitoxin system prevent-host-death family antitoxin [Bacteroidota bacterium]
MIVNATDLKNNLGKYLRLSAREEILITSNGRYVARLSAYDGAGAPPAAGGRAGEGAPVYDYAPRKATYEEFLRLTESSEERYEYIDGEIHVLASPTISHQRVLGELYGIFRQCFQGKPYLPMLAPFDITLKRHVEDINVVQPDLMVICDLGEKRNERDYYMGTPTLVVEILSESTRRKDLIEKLDLYMSTGVREYWLVNPLNKEVTVHFFEDNDLSRNATYRVGESAVSWAFPGVTASLADIFAP